MMRIAKNGNVGIGTSTPLQALEVVGTVEADGFTINGTPVGTSSDSYWNLNGLDINYATGKVGIGTTTPGAPLEVTGAVSGATDILILKDWILRL